VDLSTFENNDIEPIFVGMSMRDCARAEQVLDALAIDYAVKTELFEMDLLSTAAGAVFYVLAGQAHYCRHQLQSGGVGVGVIVPPETA
jgi:hypothetical protein